MSEQDQDMQRRIHQCGLRLAKQMVISLAIEHGMSLSTIWPPDITQAALKLYETDKALYDARAAEIIAQEDSPL